eukprot:GEMP01032842.1.p1 GENE.GEMP01032842.1~~GEMP01032842.1.p1  ORF type:complete len:251 (+),score=46.69 GEMP01032842.1:26-754(+)
MSWFPRRIYCMNLKRRLDRRIFMEKQFAAMNLAPEMLRWFDAIEGSTLDVEDLAMSGMVDIKALPRYYLPESEKLFGCDLTAGGLGCAMTIFVGAQECLYSPISKLLTHMRPDFPCLVVEDDCTFLPNALQKCSEIVATLPSDAEIVFLGGLDLLGQREQFRVSDTVFRLYRGFRETTAYLIGPRGAKSCLEVSLPLAWQIDTHMTETLHPEGYTAKPRGYCLDPPLVMQDKNLGTDIQKAV